MFFNYHSSVFLTDNWTRDKMLTTNGPPLMFTCCVTFHICRKNTMDDRTFLLENWGCLHSLTTFPLLLHLHLKKTEIIETFVTFLIKEIVITTLQNKFFFASSPWQAMCLFLHSPGATQLTLTRNSLKLCIGLKSDFEGLENHQF